MHAVKLVHIIVNFLFFRQGSCSVGCCSRIGPLNKVGFEYKIFVEHSSHEILTDYVDFTGIRRSPSPTLAQWRGILATLFQTTVLIADVPSLLLERWTAQR